MPSYFKVFPQTLGEFRGSRGDPADHVFDLQVQIAGQVQTLHIETLFRAVNDLDIEDFFRGFEITAMHLPEADTNGDLDQILSLGGSRLGRYPEPHDRPETADAPAYAGIFGDANAPIIGTAYYRRFHSKVLPDGSPAPAGDKLFRQPSGLSPNAENLKFLRRIRPDFYEHYCTTIDPYDVGRMVKNKPGFGRHGQPVHPNFDPDQHVAIQPLQVDRFQPVYIGIDAGSNTLKPAATFNQRAYSGQWRTLDEIYLPDQVQMTTQELGAEIRRKMETRFQHAPGAMLCLDPAAGGRNASSEFTTAQELQFYTGIEAQLAPSNQPKHRRAAIDRLFRTNVGPGQPAKIIDPACTGLIAGYTGGFHYMKRGQVVGVSPAKNSYSHVCEADEYAALTVEGIGPSEGRFISREGEGAADAPRVLYGD
ncbi:MAG TPA: hypothetical protein VMU59_04245 [Caulobacteraceae bacterium]|nr:hypothetical protein [Caulobacteraceae bacterium]